MSYQTSSQSTAKHPNYVVLKRKGALVDGIVHIVRAPRSSWNNHYRAEWHAVCGLNRGNGGWRVVLPRNSKKVPENLCEVCRDQNVLLELRFDGS